MQSLKRTFNYDTIWSSLLKDFIAFDDLMKGQEVLERSMWKNYSTFIVSTVLCIVHLVVYVLKEQALDYLHLMETVYVNFTITQILITVLVFKMYFVASELRYKLLQGKLTQNFSLLTNHKNYWGKEKLKNLYLLLDMTIKKINALFGQKILVLIIFTFLEILAYFQFMLLEETHREFKDVPELYSSVIHLVFLMVSILERGYLALVH